MVDFRQFLIWGALIGLFIVALTGVGVQMSLDNNVNSSFLQNQFVNDSINELETGIGTLDNTGESQSVVQSQTKTTTGSETLLIESTPNSAQAYKASSKANWNTGLKLVFSLISANPVIFITFSTIMLITFLTLIWSFVRSGR